MKLRFSNIIKSRSSFVELIKKEPATQDRTRVIPGRKQHYKIKVPVFHLSEKELEAYEGGEYSSQDVRIHEPEILRGFGIYDSWQASYDYSVDDLIKPTVNNSTGLFYKCIQAGASGSSEPVWTEEVGSTVTDNEVIWEAVGFIEQNIDIEEGDEIIYQGYNFEVDNLKDETIQADYKKWICVKLAGENL